VIENICDAINDTNLVTNLRASSTKLDTLLENAIAVTSFDELFETLLSQEDKLYYPDWENGHSACIDVHSNLPPMYMRLTGGYFENSLSACCERYFGYDYFTCMDASPGNLPRLRDGIDGDTDFDGSDFNTYFTCTSTETLGYYPDFGGEEPRCLNATDVRPPNYMRKTPKDWLFPSARLCCSSHYSWDLSSCLVSSGISPEATYSGNWYVNHQDQICQRDCPKSGSDATCGGSVKDSWPTLYDSAADCCESELSWTPIATCEAESTFGPVVGSLLWFVDYNIGKCVRDCQGLTWDSSCGGLAQRWENLYSNLSECCHELWWVDISKCAL